MPARDASEPMYGTGYTKPGETPILARRRRLFHGRDRQKCGICAAACYRGGR